MNPEGILGWIFGVTLAGTSGKIPREILKEIFVEVLLIFFLWMLDSSRNSLEFSPSIPPMIILGIFLMISLGIRVRIHPEIPSGILWALKDYYYYFSKNSPVSQAFPNDISGVFMGVLPVGKVMLEVSQQDFS